MKWFHEIVVLKSNQDANAVFLCDHVKEQRVEKINVPRCLRRGSFIGPLYNICLSGVNLLVFEADVYKIMEKLMEKYTTLTPPLDSKTRHTQRKFFPIFERLEIREWVLLCIFLRLLVAPFTIHGDFIHTSKWPHLLVHGNWDVFGEAARSGTNYYGPLLLVYLAGFQLFLKLWVPGLEEFVHSLTEHAGPLYSENLFSSLFFLKLPYLVFDLVLIKICLEMLPDRREQKKFLALWACNPVIIYAYYMMGQCDLLASFFTVLSCYFCLKPEKEKYAVLSIAAGCLFKIFPIIFLPFVLCVVGRNAKEIFYYSFYALALLAVVYGIFYLISGPSVFRVFFVVKNYNSDNTISSNYFYWLLRGLQAAVYLLLCGYVFFRHKETDHPALIRYFLTIYLTVYVGFIYYSTHLLSWLMPFLILFVLQRPRWKKTYYALLALIFIHTLRSRSSSLGIFAPLNPELFLSLPSLKDILGVPFNLNVFYKITDILFKGTALLMIFSIIKEPFISLFQRMK